MQTLKFSIDITASADAVWHALWDDQNFRNWSGLIDEGTYLKGNLVEGQTVEFISAVNGYGVTSMVEKLIPNEIVQFHHRSDTQDSGEAARANEWTGGTERYTLTETTDGTTLTISSEVPEEMVEMFRDRLPKALERIKTIAEK